MPKGSQNGIKIGANIDSEPKWLLGRASGSLGKLQGPCGTPFWMDLGTILNRLGIDFDMIFNIFFNRKLIEKKHL